MQEEVGSTSPVLLQQCEFGQLFPLSNPPHLPPCYTPSCLTAAMREATQESGWCSLSSAPAAGLIPPHSMVSRFPETPACMELAWVFLHPAPPRICPQLQCHRCLFLTVGKQHLKDNEQPVTPGRARLRFTGPASSSCEPHLLHAGGQRCSVLQHRKPHALTAEQKVLPLPSKIKQR